MGRRKLLRKYSKDLSNNPFDKSKDLLFVTARSRYKKACRNAEKSYRANLTKQLMEIGQNDPKQLWSLINRMNNWGKQQVDPVDAISSERWHAHFNNLLNDVNIAEDRILGAKCEPDTFDPILDSRIKVEEMREALMFLKSGKAPGPDGIMAEYLKIFAKNFEPLVLKLLRLIFSKHLYPEK